MDFLVDVEKFVVGDVMVLGGGFEGNVVNNIGGEFCWLIEEEK